MKDKTGQNVKTVELKTFVGENQTGRKANKSQDLREKIGM